MWKQQKFWPCWFLLIASVQLVSRNQNRFSYELWGFIRLIFFMLSGISLHCHRTRWSHQLILIMKEVRGLHDRGCLCSWFFFKKIVILCFILFHQRLHPVDVFEDVVVEEGEGPGVWTFYKTFWLWGATYEWYLECWQNNRTVFEAVNLSSFSKWFYTKWLRGWRLGSQ